MHGGAGAEERFWLWPEPLALGPGPLWTAVVGLIFRAMAGSCNGIFGGIGEAGQFLDSQAQFLMQGVDGPRPAPRATARPWER